MCRRVAALIGLSLFVALLGGKPAEGAVGDDNPPPTIDVGVVAPGGSGEARPESGGDPAPAEGVESDEPAGPSPYTPCENAGVGTGCGAEFPEAEAPAPAVDPVVLAQAALDSAAIVVPEPHTSPDGVPQMVGLATWFWLGPGSWAPVTARAELPGIWAEVTATPTHATWTPGDGAAAVTCSGPGRSHPGSAGATTDCGHTYLDVGSYTLTVEVTYAVSWTASTGASAALEPVTVGAEVAVTVEQRQAVID